MAKNVLTKREALELQADRPVMRAADNVRPGRNSGRVVQLFTNVNMGKGHDGLTLICEQHDIDVAALEPGQYIIFTNRQRNKVKVYGCNNVVAYLKLPVGHYVTIESVALIPLAFKGAPDIEHDAVLKEIFRRAPNESQMIEGARRRILVRPDTPV